MQPADPPSCIQSTNAMLKPMPHAYPNLTCTDATLQTCMGAVSMQRGMITSCHTRTSEVCLCCVLTCGVLSNTHKGIRTNKMLVRNIGANRGIGFIQREEDFKA